MGMDKYFYSEGCIYKGVDTYLEVIGTREQQEQFGKKVVDLLNGQLNSDKPITFAENRIKELKEMDLPVNSTRDNQRRGSIRAYEEMLNYMRFNN